METIMLTQNLMKTLRAKKHDLATYHAAQRRIVERCPQKIEVAVRTDLIDQFLAQAYEVPGRYHVAPGRVWRAGKHRYRDFVIGLAEDPGFLGTLAIHRRWNCSTDGEIGLGLKKVK
jgi:hypothetical protein